MDAATPDTSSRAPAASVKFNPPSVKFARRAARRLQKVHYTVEGDALKLSAAQEAVARVYGHNDWFVLVQQIERGGYIQSKLDSELAAPLLDTRRKHQRAVLEQFLGLYPGTAAKVAALAQLTAAHSDSEQHENTADIRATGLPPAGPRPGLSEILLTAHPYSVAVHGVPLPGWQQYVVVAAPIDNTALWVHFCDEQRVAAEAQQLVGKIKELSGGALATAHVSSKVLAQAPGLVGALATHGIKISGGRLAIRAARLRARLDSVFGFVSMDLKHLEETPSPEELAALLHGPAGLVEIPDSKNLSYGEHDGRPVFFAKELLRLVRLRRWPMRAKNAAQSQNPAKKERRKEFWREEDGAVKFGSGVQPIRKGAPVYRIRIELPLVDDYSVEERRVTITRVIDVPVHFDLWDLHVAIQDAMGWADYHLHQFTFYAAPTGRKTVSFGSPNEDDPDEPTSANERLWDHISALAARPARYCYDFGDNWNHQLTLVGAFPSDGGGYPRCISGERACPPEDCGSDPGYFRVLDVMAGGAAAHEHADEVSRKEMLEWLKGHINVAWPYRPGHFDPASVVFDDPQERWDYSYGDVRKDD